MTRENHFVSGIYLPQLGTGAGMALLGFRAAAGGNTQCCVLQRCFSTAFSGDAVPILSDFHVLAHILGQEGRRRVSLSRPGVARLTPDEISIVAMLSSAQRGDTFARDAHLSWLLARRPARAFSRIVEQIADRFAYSGLEIKAPPSVMHTKRMPDTPFVVQACGHA